MLRGEVPVKPPLVRAVFAQTWRRLREAERDTFMRLSVFRGGFTREAAQSVTGASLRTLAALVHKALLQGDPGGRYDSHELVRQYAEEQLEAAGQEEAAREAHCAYYLDFLGQREVDLKGGRQLEALAEIKTEYENVYIAWRWAVEQRELERLERATDSLGLFYDSQGRYLEGERACHLAGEKLAAVGDRPRILAKSYPHVANSRWYEDVAGRQIVTAAETLPPQVVAAAQERGRARDAAATTAEFLAELEGLV